MFYKILNKIKINSIKKKKILITKINTKDINLLKKLIQLNIIKYIFIKNNKFVIILNFFKKNNLIFNIKNSYKISNIKIIKYKNIKKINKTNKFILISSNYGIINNYDAENKKIGGIVITYIWN